MRMAKPEFSPCQTQMLTRVYRPELVHVKGIFDTNVEIGEVEATMTDDVKNYEWNGEGTGLTALHCFGTKCSSTLSCLSRHGHLRHWRRKQGRWWGQWRRTGS